VADIKLKVYVVNYIKETDNGVLSFAVRAVIHFAYLGKY